MQENSVSLEFFFQSEPNPKKLIKKAGLKTSIKRYLGTLIVSLFSPDELNLIYLEPQRRRKYLNTVLSQIYPEYFHALINYEETLKQRNKILTMIANRLTTKDDLMIWDQELIKYGLKITILRKFFIDEIHNDLNIFYDKIAAKQDNIEIKYKNYNDLKNALKESLEEDLRTKITNVGPHREDFELELNGRPAKHFGSRGECRSVILALKLAEKEFFKKIMNRNPIILLDDVFSELDSSRQNHLLEQIQDSQVFLTTTQNESDISKHNGIKKILDFNGVFA
jgi:DNA replication and repair protein RecF